MGPYNLVGNILIYTGLMIMLLGLVTLVTGTSAMFTQVTVKMQQAMTSSGANSGNAAAGQSAMSDANSMPEMQTLKDVVDTSLSPVGDIVDVYMENLGVIPMSDASIQEMFYPNIRRFFMMLIAGVTLVFIGTLLKILDPLIGFIAGGGRGQKSKMLARRSVMYTEYNDGRVRRMGFGDDD